MPEVYATQPLGEITLDSGSNSITVTTSAETNYSLTESKHSDAVVVNAGELAFEKLSNGTWAVAGRGTMTGSNIIIPSVYAGGDVTQIQMRAFYQDPTLQQIYIPKSITSIGGQAFKECTTLTSVQWEDTDHAVIFFKKPDSWATPYVYYKYGNATNNDGLGTMMDLADASKSLYSCAVPINTTEIRFRSEDEQYTTMSYHITTEELSNCRFTTSASNYGYELNIEEYYDPGPDFNKYNGLRLGSQAFAECTGLTIINLPQRVTSIETGAFKGCTNLTNVSNPIHNRLLDIADEAFNGCTKLQTVMITSGLRRIGKSAFVNCSKLEGFNFGATLKDIEQYAFKECRYLDRVTIPASVERIGRGAFQVTPWDNGYSNGRAPRWFWFEDPYTWFTSISNAPSSDVDMTAWKPTDLYGVDILDYNVQQNGNRLCYDQCEYYWHKLKRMLPPKVSLSDNILTMTDPLGVAEKFYIYVNGGRDPRVTIDLKA